MSLRLDTMRTNCRLVTDVIGKEVFSATLRLGDLLPNELYRARMVCLPVLISVTRDLIDREMRSLPVGRGPSINAISASLDMPFETVRRNVQKMAELGWVVIGTGGGVTLPVPMPTELADWCVDLASRLRHAAKMIEDSGTTTCGTLGDGNCDNSCILAALDLFLIMAGTCKDFSLRFGEYMLVQTICAQSTRHLGRYASDLVPFARADTVPGDAQRAFIPLAEIANTLGISRSTAYRIINHSDHEGLFERRGTGVRGAYHFLSSPTYIAALELVAGRTATLFSRVERHRCERGCTALDHMLRRPRPWQSNMQMAMHAAA